VRRSYANPENSLRNMLSVDWIHNLESVGFACKKCGRCCVRRESAESVVLYEDDVLALSQNVGMSDSQFLDRYTQLRKYTYRFLDGRIVTSRIILKMDPACVFQESNKCVVHAVKPYQCRAAPFVIPLLVEPAMFAAFVSRCPGFLEGPAAPKNVIVRSLAEQYSKEVRWFRESDTIGTRVYSWVHDRAHSDDATIDVAYTAEDYSHVLWCCAHPIGNSERR
jgi:Fe-S-cluster containining protein